MDAIRRTIEFSAPIERVWAFLTETDKIAEWLMPNNFEARLGHEFTMDCPPDVGSGAPVKCVVTEIAPPASGSARLVYTWEIDQPLTVTTLEIDLTESGETTRLDLVHSGWEDIGPDDEHVYQRHDMGWDFLLGEALKGLVEA